jgi:transposase-like protein
MAAELELFLGEESQKGNKRNGFVTRSFGIKGVGTIEVRVPRDRRGKFRSNVIPPQRKYDQLIEQDLALLHLAGLSTRTLAQLSHKILGVRVSHSEVSQSLHTVIPGARRFLERSLAGRQFMYLYVDGTSFHVRRQDTVAREPVLVVIGVDTQGKKSVLCMSPGDKDSRPAWERVFSDLKARGLDAAAVKLGIMDGLPGLPEAFVSAFPNSQVARCWVHKLRNVMTHVPRRFQALFKQGLDNIMYAESLEAAEHAWTALNSAWSTTCQAALECLQKDRKTLLVHYTFPKEHWTALRTTNPIERVNRELKRRSKAMDTVGPTGLQALLAFTALRLEANWGSAALNNPKMKNLRNQQQVRNSPLEQARTLLN